MVTGNFMKISNKTPLDVLEKKVTDFLCKYAHDEYAKNEVAPYLAKVSLHLNHLYQDLGFTSRTEMNRYMQEHFPKLCELKPKNKLWKKFIYDSIEEIAPACATCSDQENCWNCDTL